MSDLAVRVEGLSKEYRLGGPRERYSTLRDRLNKLASAPFRALRGRRERSEQDGLFWALKDVSFEVKRGEVVGIIGRNGAGKSTLLKILSRITEPTEGEVDISGRVGSLLEVGTGFHPELTGRENVYLNGAILGMRQAEIARKFDEIVAFAEVEKFVDTPVKHYSSGMYMRLAFAVAAHLEPEILIVDEVLAVGDMEFQKKCLGKMGEVARGGRTVLFVSHNMGAVQNLCTQGVLLDSGRVVRAGSVAFIVQGYTAKASEAGHFDRPAQTNGRPTLIRGRLDLENNTSGHVLRIEVTISKGAVKCVALDLRLKDQAGSPVAYGSLGVLKPRELIPLRDPLTQVTFRMPLDQLALGHYFVTLGLTEPTVELYDIAEQCLSFEVHRPPGPGCARILTQAWQCGCYEIPLERSG